MKKFLATVLSIALLVCLAVPVLAAEPVFGIPGGVPSGGDSSNVNNNNNSLITGVLCKVTGYYVNIRTGPSTDSTSLTKVNWGDVVDVLGITEDGWLMIGYNNDVAYIYSKYVSFDQESLRIVSPTQSVGKVLEVAADEFDNCTGGTDCPNIPKCDCMNSIPR